MLLSYLMLSHNRLNYLKEAVSSVLKQSVPDWELIIVDDSRSKEINSFLDSLMIYNNIVICKLSQEKQIAIKRDITLHLASGVLCTPLDDDDLAKPNRTGDLINTYLKHKVDFIYGKVDYLKLDNGVWSKYEGVYSNIEVGNTAVAINGGAIAFTKEIAIRVGGYKERIGSLLNKDSMRGEDWRLYRRILNETKSYIELSSIISTVRRHETNISLRPRKRIFS